MDELPTYEIPVFADLKLETALKRNIDPAEIVNPRKPKTWSLTPLGVFEKDTCAYLIDILRKRGDNAIILNTEGELEFGVVVKNAP